MINGMREDLFEPIIVGSFVRPASKPAYEIEEPPEQKQEYVPEITSFDPVSHMSPDIQQQGMPAATPASIPSQQVAPQSTAEPDLASPDSPSLTPGADALDIAEAEFRSLASHSFDETPPDLSGVPEPNFGGEFLGAISQDTGIEGAGVQDSPSVQIDPASSVSDVAASIDGLKSAMGSPEFFASEQDMPEVKPNLDSSPQPGVSPADEALEGAGPSTPEVEPKIQSGSPPDSFDKPQYGHPYHAMSGALGVEQFKDIEPPKATDFDPNFGVQSVPDMGHTGQQVNSDAPGASVSSVEDASVKYLSSLYRLMESVANTLDNHASRLEGLEEIIRRSI